jgi:L-glutamine:scyllo-inosose aminotransferase/L-glutamine:2-deoxy-scyllo-inosose/3-amino-2,3-dideoxy-scyllo-inosose aminotransferase
MAINVARLSGNTLALLGGTPAYSGNWPTWPQATDEIMDALADVARSGRWAISGAFTGRECWEKRFTTAFAGYLGARFAVPTANGTAALTIALESQGVGSGAEVLVPGLTWVACASAPLVLGAIPILVDVDARTFSMSLEAAAAAITPRTEAILLVHAYCQVADPEAFAALAERNGLALIEDCSQAHGAEWKGRRVGTFGRASAFSLQQVKVLTCGEGGIASTDDPDTYERMQQLRADGRIYKPAPVAGELELDEVGSIQGRNYCLSEFQAAIATVQLAKLDRENGIRAHNASLLAEELRRIPGISVPPALDGVTRRTYYQFLVHFDPQVLGPYDPEKVVAALAAELGVFCELIDAPLNANPLYVPLSSPRMPKRAAVRRAVDPSRFDLPTAAKLRSEHVAFGHWALLGGPVHRRAMVDAFAKVAEQIDHLYRD